MSLPCCQLRAAIRLNLSVKRQNETDPNHHNGLAALPRWVWAAVHAKFGDPADL